MPDYKVVNSEQLNADITLIADAIREKVGTTEELSFPAGLIEAITNMSAGGGGADGQYLLGIDAGIATFAGVAGDYTVEHSLGIVPNFYIFSLYDHYPITETDTYYPNVCHIYVKDYSNNFRYINTSVSWKATSPAAYQQGTAPSGASNAHKVATDTHITFVKGWPPTHPSGPYVWVCGVMGRTWN